jgi:hypothetical protein
LFNDDVISGGISRIVSQANTPTKHIRQGSNYLTTPQALRNIKLEVVHPDSINPGFMIGGGTDDKRRSSSMFGAPQYLESLNNKMGNRPSLRRDNESLACKQIH